MPVDTPPVNLIILPIDTPVNIYEVEDSMSLRIKLLQKGSKLVRLTRSMEESSYTRLGLGDKHSRISFFTQNLVTPKPAAQSQYAYMPWSSRSQPPALTLWTNVFRILEANAERVTQFRKF